MIPYNQLSLADIFSDCQEIYESDKPAFLSLLLFGSIFIHQRAEPGYTL